MSDYINISQLHRPQLVTFKNESTIKIYLYSVSNCCLEEYPKLGRLPGGRGNTNIYEFLIFKTMIISYPCNGDLNWIKLLFKNLLQLFLSTLASIYIIMLCFYGNNVL